MSEPSAWEGLLFAFVFAGGCLALGFVGAVAFALIERWMDR